MIRHDSIWYKPTKPRGNHRIQVNPLSFSPFQPPILQQSLTMSPSQRLSRQKDSSRETHHDKYANKTPNEETFRRWSCAMSDPAMSEINVNSNVHRPLHQEIQVSSGRIKTACLSWWNSEGLIMWCRNRLPGHVTYGHHCLDLQGERERCFLP